MKALRLCALMAAAVISVGYASAEIINVSDHFYSTFSTEEDFNAWSTVDVNGTNDGNGRVTNFWKFDENQSSAFIEPGVADTDDWLFTPKVSLSGGKEYIVKINLWADWTCRFQITMGKEASPESQTEVTGVEELDGQFYQVYTLPADIEAGDYYFGIHSTISTEDNGWLYIKSVEIVESKDGSVAFTLLNDKTGDAIEGVDLHLSGPTYLETVVATDENGKASFSSLTPGTYSVKYEITGLMDPSPVLVEVGDKEAVEYTLRARMRPVVKVDGKVVDHRGQPCSEVNVAFISTVQNYSVTTDADGAFAIDEIFGDTEYEVLASKFTKNDFRTTLSLSSDDKTLETITMTPYFGKPSGVTTDNTENGMFVSWMTPVGHKEFSYDNGAYYGLYLGNYDYMYYGTRFNEPMTVEEINWVVAELNDGKVNLGVYLIDKYGNIATTPVFSATDVPSGTYRWEAVPTWNSYKLAEPVEAPYGCVVSVSHAGGMSMCCDGVECYNNVVATGNMENGWEVGPSFVGAFFIRAKGEALTRNATVVENAPSTYKVSSQVALRRAPQTIIEGVKYKVCRIAGDNIENTEAWTTIADGLKALYTIDTEFGTLPQNNYRYAVKAISESGDESAYAFSKVLAHNMSTTLNLQVYTNTAIELADGAAVTLKGSGEDATVYAAVVTDNKVSFIDIPKDYYTLTVEKYGYNTIQQEIDLTTENLCNVIVELPLAPLAPFSLAATQEEESSDVVLSWNREDGIFEDFEAMEDFAINPSGEIGWTYADIDQATTYGVTMCAETPYPNMHSPMAFQAFNPSATTPDITEFVQPFSGKKVLVDVSCETGVQNDDYMFSPELSYDSQFVFRFHAASGFFGLMGYEKFMVGYTTGAAEPENVIWLTEKPVSVGALWTEFTYTMPAEARHTVIRCVSNDCMFFMLDDIFIGKVEADVFAMTSFKVELDGEDAGTTTSRSFTFNNLESGKHIARVQTIYTLADASNLYSDFAEIVFNVAPTSSVGQVEVESLYSYDPQARLLTAGEGVIEMTVFDVNGRLVASGASISLDNVVSGVYVVNVIAGDGRKVADKIVL